jgi:beta-glucosidase
MQITLPASSPMRDREFLFGVATSAFQIEGAAELRRPSIWDTFCATPGKIRDGSDGRVACEHVARWREDLALLAQLGVDAYRLSISWPRVIKADGSLDARGVDFYLQLLDALNAQRCRPFVTLYHWDLPQSLQDAGGWLDRDTPWRFQDYVDRISRAFGDRVYSYATLNEPWCSAYLGHELGVHAPGIANRRAGLQAAHHLLLAHGLGMQALAANSPGSRNGIVLNFTPCYAASASAADQAAAVAADVRLNQWYLQPLMEGRYPELLERLPGHEQPDIRPGDLELIAHELDYLGVNYYSRGIFRADPVAPYVQVPPPPPLTEMGWEIYPAGLTDLLVSLHRRYRLPSVYIAENGVATADQCVDGVVDDEARIRFFQSHLDALGAAMASGVKVAGYFHWSLLDNFEWAEGYGRRFGLVHVDYASQRRTLKASGHAYAALLGARAAARRPVP